MNKIIGFCLCILSMSAFAIKLPAYSKIEKQNLQQFQKMHQVIVEHHKTEDMDKFFHPQFELFSNKEHFNYPEYKQIYSKLHKHIYANTTVTYKHLFAKNDRVSAYVSYDIVKKDGNKKHIDSMIIAEMDHGKIKKIYELAYAR